MANRPQAVAEVHPEWPSEDGAPPSDRGEDLSRRPKLVYRLASTISPTRPEWLWSRWLSVGNLHLLVGRQGGGKTTWAAWVVGMLTSGRTMPGDSAARPPVTCGLLSLEESDERLVARLHATGADVSRVAILGEVDDNDGDERPYTRPWRLPHDCAVLEDRITELHLGLVVVDGLGYSVISKTQDYTSIGAALSALAKVAERTGCAILGLTHPPKGGSDPVTAAIGSTAWTAVARTVWVMGVEPRDDTETRRAICVSKSNYKEPECGYGFIIADYKELDCGYVTALSPSSTTAEELVAGFVPAEERTALQEAQEVVRSILAEGPMATAAFKKAANESGLSDRTIERARRALGVRSQPSHDPVTGTVTRWTVELPTTPPVT